MTGQQARSPSTLKTHFYNRLSQPGHPGDNWSNGEEHHHQPATPQLMRKFKQRLGIYPRLCQAPPQEQLLLSPFPSTPGWPALPHPRHQFTPSRGFQSHFQLSSPAHHSNPLSLPHGPEKAPPNPPPPKIPTPDASISIASQEGFLPSFLTSQMTELY